ARAEDFPDVTEETFARAAIEIADRAAEKKHEKVIAGLAVAGDGAQSIEIRPLEPDDADKVDVAEFLFAGLQGGGRDFDWVVAGFLAAKGLRESSGSFCRFRCRVRRHGWGGARARRFQRRALGGGAHRRA